MVVRTLNQVTGPSLNKIARWKTLRRDIWRARWAYIFITPFLIIFLVFNIFPPLYSAWLSFHQWDILTPIKSIGFANYIRIFTRDQLFWKSILNGVLMGVMATIPGLFSALLLAYILDVFARKYRHIFMAAYFSPRITSAVAVGMTFGALFGGVGLINYALRSLGIPPVRWLEEVWSLRATLAFLLLWEWTGWNIVIFTSGLQSIPFELYESAMVDGANGWDMFWKITIPMVRPTIIFTGVMSTIGILQLFAEPMLLIPGASNGNGASLLGGQDNAILTTPLYLYNIAFRQFQFGLASAQSYILFAVILSLALINSKILGGRTTTEEGAI